jgi:hypothetical protein
MVLVRVSGRSTGHILMNPFPVGPMTVILADTAFAMRGTPQTPAIGKILSEDEARGAPERVSMTRQGVSVWKSRAGVIACGLCAQEEQHAVTRIATATSTVFARIWHLPPLDFNILTHLE